MSKPKFWKPGDAAPGQSLTEERKSSQERESQPAVYNPNVSLSIEQQRQKLPVFQLRNHILYMLEKYQTVVIVGSTGCGKSTQIPQYLLEAGWADQDHVIAVTQPRRVAAITVASRVAEERGAVLGHEVGYLIRFDDCFDENATRVKFMTDGMLIREIMNDPLLSKYSVVMLDEAHERSLNTDIIMGLVRKIQNKRADLRVIVASATLDAEEIKDFFNRNETGDESQDTAGILTIEGRAFPVDIHYSLDPVPDYIKATVETVTKIHHNEKPGDVLAFMTGMDEVNTVTSMLIEEAKKVAKVKDALKMKIVPMHGSLPAAEQMKAFERTPKYCRKIVIATNIAETSITINGIVYIVDCGFVKLRAYHPKSGIESLVIVPVSQASANQRAGRAGRVRAGKAYRLYTEEDYGKLSSSTTPEMQRSDLAPVILQMKALGVANVLRFHFLSAPPAQNMVRGLELLYALGALDDNGNLTTPLGLRMAEFPLPPMFAKMLLVSDEFSCSEEAVTIAAMSQIQNVFISPSGQRATADRAKFKFAVEQGDHVTLVNVYRAFEKYGRSGKWCHENFLNYKGLCRAGEIRAQLSRLLKKCNIPLVSCGGKTRIDSRATVKKSFFSSMGKRESRKPGHYCRANAEASPGRFGGLLIGQGDGKDQMFPIDAPLCLIGRERNCDVIINNKHVADRHFQVEINSSNQAFFRGLASEDFSTTLNGTQVQDLRFLKNADRITLGGIDIIYYTPVPSEKNEVSEKRRQRMKPEDAAKIYCIAGRGVFTQEDIEQGEFLLEYRGQLKKDIQPSKVEDTNYTFHFKFKGVNYCLDATEETSDLGRLVNHADHVSQKNSVMKLIEDETGPHLCLFSSSFLADLTGCIADFDGYRSPHSTSRGEFMIDDITTLCRCITAGFFANAAKLHPSGQYRTARDDHTLHVHPMSVLYTQHPAQWVVFNEVIQTTKDFMSDVTVINPDWLCELAPNFYQFGTEREIAAKRVKLDDG